MKNKAQLEDRLIACKRLMDRENKHSFHCQGRAWGPCTDHIDIRASSYISTYCQSLEPYLEGKERKKNKRVGRDKRRAFC